MASLGSDIRAIVNAIQARLNGHPDSAEEWQTIARQLRSASDKARKIHKLGVRMETPEVFRDSDLMQETIRESIR